MVDHRFTHDKAGGHCSRSDLTISHHHSTRYRASPQGLLFVLPKPSHLKLIEHNLATAIRIFPQPDNFVRSSEGNAFLEAVSRVSTVPPNIPPRLRDKFSSCESYASLFRQHPVASGLRPFLVSPHSTMSGTANHHKLAVTSLRRG